MRRLNRTSVVKPRRLPSSSTLETSTLGGQGKSFIELCRSENSVILSTIDKATAMQTHLHVCLTYLMLLVVLLLHLSFTSLHHFVSHAVPFPPADDCLLRTGPRALCFAGPIAQNSIARERSFDWLQDLFQNDYV